MYKALTSNIEKNDPFKFYFGLITSFIVCTGIFLSCIHLGELKTDGSIFSAVALKDLSGGVLYVNAWENKPPGIFYLIELFFIIIPNPIYAVFTLAYVSFIATSFCLYTIILNNVKSYIAGILFTSIAIFFTMYGNNIGDGLCTEIHGTLSILISMVFFMAFQNSPKSIYLIVSSISLGFSFWFKEPFIFVFIALFIINIRLIKIKKEKIIYTLSAILPSIFFIVLLYFQNSLHGYIDSIKYNFTYLNIDEPISLKVKINDLYSNLIHPILTAVLFFTYLAYKTLLNKKTSGETLAQLIFLISTGIIFGLSPHNFGHYYYPTFTLIFVVFSKIYALYFEAFNIKLTWPLILICIYTLYRIDERQKPNLTFEIKPMVSDKFVKYLKGNQGKTLFVDYVVKGDYYIKSGLIYPSFLPIALPIHFGENLSGIENRNRIWKELSKNPPDFLITTYTSSYFSWYLPDPKFYENNYYKIDSIQPENDNVLYLWKYKSSPLIVR